MKKLLPVVAFILFPLSALAASGTPAPAQEKAAALAVVQRFFDAMVARDAKGMADTFLPGTQYALAVRTADGCKTKQKTIEALIAEAQQDPQPWLERIWHPVVLIEDRIATVWARYDFHKGADFSHNGTDCYTLLKTDTGWKIAGLVFTIEPDDKTEHPAGPPH